MFDFLTKKLSSVFSQLTGKSHLSEKNIHESLQKIRESLIEADVPFKLVDEFMEEIKQDVVGKKVTSAMNPGEQFVKTVYDRLLAFLGGQYLQESFTFQIPSVISVMGLQGSGKTTTIAKLAHFIQKAAQKRGKKRRILCASVDFYRPAAIDQLEILAGQVQIDFYRAQATDVVAACQEIINQYRQGGYELLLLDTAGRLHVDDTMMKELSEVLKLAKPKYKFLVLDAMTGQESLQVAQTFLDSVGFDYAILSKMDSDTRGGAAFAFRYALQKPVLFMGVGEKPENLELFRPERVAKRMLGMGDLLTLVENANDKIKKSEQESLEKSFRSGNITLDDFAKQLNMINKLGSLGSLMKYLPGMGGAQVSGDDLERGEKEMKKFRAIISSMKPEERRNPRLLTTGRKQKIANGSGVKVADIDMLLQRFEQSKHFVKLLKKNRFFNKF